MDVGPPFGRIGNLKRSNSDSSNSLPGANRTLHSRDRSIRSGFAIPRTPFLRANKAGKACGGRATTEIAVVANDGETAPLRGWRRPSRHRCRIESGRCVVACTFQLTLESRCEKIVSGRLYASFYSLPLTSCLFHSLALGHNCLPFCARQRIPASHLRLFMFAAYRDDYFLTQRRGNSS